MKESNKLIPILAIVFAIAITAAAAFYSVSGLAKVFAGASMAVIILAGILESSKLVIATILHRYWSRGLGVAKYLLMSILLGLMLITSAGIYGFLSNAYKQTSARNEVIENRVAVIEGKQKMIEERRLRYIREKRQYTTRLSALDSSLMSLNTQNTDFQYTNEEGNVVTYASSRKLKDLKERREYIRSQISETKIELNKLDSLITLADSDITNYESEIIETNAGNEAAAELGPVIYISDITGWSVDDVVSYFILLFVLIVDPLAVTLVIIGNNTLMMATSGSKKDDDDDDDDDGVIHFDKKYTDEDLVDLYIPVKDGVTVDIVEPIDVDEETLVEVEEPEEVDEPIEVEKETLVEVEEPEEADEPIEVEVETPVEVITEPENEVNVEIKETRTFAENDPIHTLKFYRSKKQDDGNK